MFRSFRAASRQLLITVKILKYFNISSLKTLISSYRFRIVVHSYAITIYVSKKKIFVRDKFYRTQFL